jgi:hypothetical protein
MSCEVALKAAKKIIKIKHLEYWDRFLGRLLFLIVTVIVALYGRT